MWLPDETFFSLCSRHHRLSGNSRSLDTYIELFGRPGRARVDDFPAQMDLFVEQSVGILGAADEIILAHTLVPFYFWLLPRGRATAAMEILCRGSRLGLRPLIGLTSRRLSSSHSLKACATCIQHDRRTFGTGYWHLSHQFPGSVMCVRHGTVLGRSRNAWPKGNGPWWYLPTPETVDFGQEVSVQVAKAGSMASELARSIGVCGARARLQPWLLSRAYARAFNERGLLSPHSMRLRRSDVDTELGRFIALLSEFHDFKDLWCAREHALSVAIALLSMGRVPTNPLWHIPLIAWAFESWPQLRSACRTVLRTISPAGRHQSE
ncbi:TniQ family protein [Variovorax sp. LjRoot175]